MADWSTKGPYPAEKKIKSAWALSKRRWGKIWSRRPTRPNGTSQYNSALVIGLRAVVSF